MFNSHIPPCDFKEKSCIGNPKYTSKWKCDASSFLYKCTDIKTFYETLFNCAEVMTELFECLGNFFASVVATITPTQGSFFRQ